MKANYLASPPLVVAYALAGRMDIDLATEPIGHDPDGGEVYLRDLWPSSDEIDETIAATVSDELFRGRYADVFTGDETWRALESPRGTSTRWEPESTYVRRPPYFDGMPLRPARRRRTSTARAASSCSATR